MKLARVKIAGKPTVGRIEGDQFIPFEGDVLWSSPATASRSPVDISTLTFLPPVEPGKIIGIGRNYAEHAAEIGKPIGSVPSVFLKPPNSIIGHDDAVVLPPRDISKHVEHEAELAVVIGRPARNVPRDRAADIVLGYTCANDVSARDIQKADPQITRGKGFDTFCPIGPVIETDVHFEADVEIICKVNGEIRQRGTTADLVFDIPYLIAHLSSWTTLLPGDVILTGSPGGTSQLHPGDLVEISVDGVGTLRHGVVAGS